MNRLSKEYGPSPLVDSLPESTLAEQVFKVALERAIKFDSDCFYVNLDDVDFNPDITDFFFACIPLQDAVINYVYKGEKFSIKVFDDVKVIESENRCFFRRTEDFGCWRFQSFFCRLA